MKRRRSTPLSALGGLLAAYLCVPLIASLPRIISSDWTSVDWHTLGNASAISAASATLAACLIALGGIPLGYWLSRRRSRFTTLVGFVVQLPLALPPLTSGILLLILIGPYSDVGRIFPGGLTDSFAGIVVASVFVASPFLIIAARSAFDSVDPILEDVGATLGHGRYPRFFYIALPLAWPSIRAGLLLSWLRAFGEFGATVMVAYHPYSLPVYTYVAFGSQGLPAMMPIILPTLVLALLATLAIAGTSRHGWSNDRAGSTTPPAPAANIHSQALPTHLDERVPAPPPYGASALTQAPAALTFHFQKAMGAFVLDVTWTTSAKRLAILGASGSGKSMTLRMIAGLETADRASMSFGGADYLRKAAEQRHIAYVPQDYGLFPHLRVAQQWSFARDADAQAARYWSRHLGLEGLEQRYPNTLSLGQRQRVSIVRALSRPCPLILLDEPFSALDTPRRRQLRESLRTLQSEISATTIVVTHDPDEAALLADEVLVIDQGKVLQAGPTAMVFSRPANLRVAELLGLSNVGEGYLTPSGVLQLGVNGVNGEPILLEPSVPVQSASTTQEALAAAAAGNASDVASASRVLWRIDPSAVRFHLGLNLEPDIEPDIARRRIEAGQRADHAAIVTGQRLIDGRDFITASLGAATLLIPQRRHHQARLIAGATVYLDIDPTGIDVWLGSPENVRVPDDGLACS